MSAGGINIYNKFVIGIAIMLFSFAAGFTIGAFTIFLALALWLHVIIKYYRDFRIRVASGILLVTTIIEAWVLMPG